MTSEEEEKKSLHFVAIPDNMPIPKFSFGIKVYIKDSDNCHGKILGMKVSPYRNYSSQYWQYMVYDAFSSNDEWYEDEDLSVEKWPEDEDDGFIENL